MEVLLTSIAFPPKRDPECLQTAKYFKALVGEGIDIRVVTSSSPTLFMPNDPSLNKYDQGWKQKIEIPIFENRYSNFLLRKLLKDGIDFPDSKFTFYWQWKKVIRKLDVIPDIIYSRSFPLSSAILGYKLSRYYKRPWVMHLSDPWLYSPLHHLFGRQQKFHQEWETKCFKAADAICFTSTKTIELYKSYYPGYASKFHFFPNVYEESDQEQLITKGEKLRIIYTGGLVGDRNVLPLINALQLIKDDNLLCNIEIIFAGALDRKNAEIFRLIKFNCIKHVGELNFNQVHRLQLSAHILLLIDNPIKSADLAVYFPSKLLDYMIAKRRIWTIATPFGTSWEVMNDLQGETFSYEDPEKLASAIKEAYNQWKDFNQDYFFSKNLPKQYSSTYNAKRLAYLMKELCQIKK